MLAIQSSGKSDRGDIPKECSACAIDTCRLDSRSEGAVHHVGSIAICLDNTDVLVPRLELSHVEFQACLSTQNTFTRHSQVLSWIGDCISRHCHPAIRSPRDIFVNLPFLKDPILIGLDVLERRKVGFQDVGKDSMISFIGPIDGVAAFAIGCGMAR